MIKKILLFTTIISISFAISPCEDGEDTCAYQYKTPIGNELKVINMRNVPIIFSIQGGIGYRTKTIYNRVLKPYQTYTVEKKMYKTIKENIENIHYRFSAQNYNPKIKQDIKFK